MSANRATRMGRFSSSANAISRRTKLSGRTTSGLTQGAVALQPLMASSIAAVKSEEDIDVAGVAQVAKPAWRISLSSHRTSLPQSFGHS